MEAQHRAARNGSAARVAWAVVTATIVGVFLGIVGPFGSYLNGSVLTRIAYWVLSMWLGVAFYGSAFVLARLLAARSGIPLWIATAFLVMAASLPQALATSALALYFWPNLAQLSLSQLDWFMQVLVLAGPVTLGYAFWTGLLSPVRAARPTPDRTASGEPDDASGLFALLPPRLGTDIICMAMEDHYVRVHTALGSDLLLMPMARAVADVAGVEGCRVHRSWWVARSAVLRIDGPARTMRLRLVNGMDVPVARRTVTMLRGLGWLDQPVATSRPSSATR
ncbi:MAG: LytTR family DNA-binding domain-containing protein [Sphingomonas sp.]